MTNKFPERLVLGYKAFFYSRLRHERTRYETLASDGQNCEIMIISCCDSRAAPEIVFDAAPGEIFVVRNVANLVPPYQPDGDYHGTSAALEFAVQQIRVKHIVVMGHGRCGGVHAFRAQLDGQASGPLSPGDFIGKWISLLQPATDDMRCGADAGPELRQRALEEASVRSSISNLMTFPNIAAKAGTGEIELHGAWFDIASGGLWQLDRNSGNFYESPV